MERIASGIIDKLNIIGFFNVIISGGVLLYGISPLLDKYVPGLFSSQLGIENDLAQLVAICLACYILGSALNSLQEQVFKGFKTSIRNRCLSGVSTIWRGISGKCVIANKYKRARLIMLAEKMFTEKNLGTFNPEDPEMCSGFIDYCEASNAMKGNGGTAERFNESATFYEQLSVAFFILTAIGIVMMVFFRLNVWAYCLGYLVLATVFAGRAYQCCMHWARNVLSTYLAIAESEETEQEGQ